MLQITPSIYIDERELTFDFIRASGPGGQNVNKVATAVQLRFNIPDSHSLSTEVKLHLLKALVNRSTEAGILIIDAHRYRSQEQNRQDAVQRFIAVLRRASEKPKPRKKTRPTLASKMKRVESKKRRGELKRGRTGKLIE